MLAMFAVIVVGFSSSSADISVASRHPYRHRSCHPAVLVAAAVMLHPSIAIRDPASREHIQYRS